MEFPTEHKTLESEGAFHIPATTPSSKKNTTLVILACVIVFFTIGTAGYYLGIQEGLRQQSQSIVTLSSPSPTATQETTPAGLEKYSNPAMGVTLFYPDKLTLHASDDEAIFAFDPSYSPRGDGTAPKMGRIQIVFHQSVDLPAYAFDDLHNAQVGEDVPLGHGAIDVKITKLKNLRIGDYDAVEYIRDGVSLFNNDSGRGFIGYEHNVLIKKDENTFILLKSDSRDASVTQQNDSIFNTVVESLKLQ